MRPYIYTTHIPHPNIHPVTVPCVKRTSAVDNAAAAEELIGCTGTLGAQEDEWVAPQIQPITSARDANDDDDIVDIDASGEEVPKVQASGAEDEDDDAIPDIDDLAIDDEDEVYLCE